jgi:hypothetical protein
MIENIEDMIKAATVTGRAPWHINVTETIALTAKAPAGTAVNIVDVITALASAAIGALAGLYALSPMGGVGHG